MHRTTDPACSKHRPPRTALSRRHHDRNRGRYCPTCMPGNPTPRHRIRMEVLIDAEGRWYGWYCTRCSECSMLNRNLIRAWWASLHYRRHGICRPLPDLIIEITAETKGFAAPQTPAPPRMNGSTAIASGNVAGSLSPTETPVAEMTCIHCGVALIAPIGGGLYGHAHGLQRCQGPAPYGHMGHPDMPCPSGTVNDCLGSREEDCNHLVGPGGENR